MNPADDGSAASILTFQANASSQSGYNETLTSAFFSSKHGEDDGGASIQFEDGEEISQGTGYQQLTRSGIGSSADESGAGTLWLFNPSNTTYVTHWQATFTYYTPSSGVHNDFIAGYFNVTAAITNLNFKFYNDSAFDGVIKMYGVG